MSNSSMLLKTNVPKGNETRKKIETKKEKGEMKMKYVNLKKLTLGVGLAAFAYTGNAVGTNAGVNITNQASVDYVVGGINQTDVNSNLLDFEVDRRVSFTVVSNGNENVTPAETLQVLAYTITNTANDTLDFVLSSAIGSGDDVASRSVFVETGGGAGYQAGNDTATFVDELAEDATIVVYVVSTIAAAPTAANGDATVVHLAATAHEAVGVGQGAVLTETGAADVAGTVENVFGDGDGSGADVANDGIHSDDGTYNVVSATIAVVKTSVIVTDPINGAGANRKRIPGAVIRYTLAISNTGGAQADNLAITDILDANTTYVAASLTVDGVAEDDNAIGADETDPNGGSFAGNTVSASILALAAAATKNVVFDVTINN